MKKIEKKIFVLDTNVLLHDAECFKGFGENDIVIILPVLEELDTFKSKSGDLGANARNVARFLDEMRSRGSLNKGVKISEKLGKILVIESIKAKDFPSELRESVDNALLETAFELAKRQPTVLVTKDINLRVKADVLKIEVEDYINEKNSLIYNGYEDLELSKDEIEDLKFTTRLRLPKNKLVLNQYYSVKENGNEKSAIVLARAMQEDLLMFVDWCNKPIIGIVSRNLEQHFLMDALLDNNIKLVTVQGKAGTGKTLLSIAAALYKTYVDFSFTKIKLMRPVIPVDKGIGFLPGTLEEKMLPWMAPIYNNLEFLKQCDRKSGRSVLPINFDESEVMEVAPISFIRGQSVANSIMIIDEAQNLSPLEMKTIVTRAGEGTKLIFTGDIEQIDHPYLTKFDNGLTYLASKFRGNHLHCHISLQKGERSELAEVAADIL